MGAKVVLDGIELSDPQKRTLSELVFLLENAGHDPKTARRLAEGGFRRMHLVEDGAWRAAAVVRLAKGHGVTVPSKFRRREDAMSRSKAEGTDEVRKARDGLVMQTIGEAGARNSGKDKEAIKNLVTLSLNLLNQADQEEVLKGIRKAAKGGGK